MTPHFFEKIFYYESVSVVGTAKNAGKTFCLRSLLRYHRDKGSRLAVTSIGVDGESTDALYHTVKPELTFYPGMWVQTSEYHYRQRHLTGNIVHLSQNRTALGRLVTAQVEVTGKMILSGPSHTEGLKDFIKEAQNLGASTVLIDGALSRMSLASPSVAKAMILCTGASLSKNLTQVVQDAVFRCELMKLPLYTETLFSVPMAELEKIQQGVWGLSASEGLIDLGLRSTLLSRSCKEKFASPSLPNTFFVSGAVTDPFLQFLLENTEKGRTYTLVISDFTKMFASCSTYKKFLRRGGKIYILQQTQLLAVCANPYSPEGYSFPLDALKQNLSCALGQEVFVLED